MNERRLARLAEQIKQRLAQILQRDLADPKLGLVTITRIELDREFTQCKAYWSVIATKDREQRARRESEDVLHRARGLCQREMGKVLHTRTIPHLTWVFDEGIAGAIRVNTLLNELNETRSDAPATTNDTDEAVVRESTPADGSTPADAGSSDAPDGPSPSVSEA